MRYLLIRLALLVPQLLGVIVVMFIITHMLPGDPITALVGDFPAPPEYVRALRDELGLDLPMPTQFARYLGKVASGDLGYSFAYRQPVIKIVGARIGATLLLTGTALLIGSLFGIFLGTIAAARRRSALDTTISFAAVAGFAVPSFWLGQMLILIFASTLQWLPATGMVNLRDPAVGFFKVLDVAEHLILPAVALSFAHLALTARLTRSSVIEALGQDYVRTARAKGLAERKVVFRHALSNALLPVLTALGYNMGFLLSGSALVETVFGWPGMGRLLYDSLFKRDNAVLMGIFLTTSLAAILANLLTDLAYARIDPRIKYS